MIADVQSFIPLGKSMFVRTHEICNELYVNISNYMVDENYKLYSMGVTLTESEFKQVLEAIEMDISHMDEGELCILTIDKGIQIIKENGNIYLKRDQMKVLLESKDIILIR